MMIRAVRRAAGTILVAAVVLSSNQVSRTAGAKDSDAVPPSQAGVTSSPLRAAAVKADITPANPQWLMGYQARQSTGVHDPIYHRVLALEANGTQFTFYFGYTNGWFGYLPTAKGFEEGGYEPRTSPFTAQAEADVSGAVTAFIQGFRR